MPPDNWVYIQEPDVRVGRLQIFNNWSAAMVAIQARSGWGWSTSASEGDELWSMNDGKFIDFAAGELEKLGMIDRDRRYRRNSGSSTQGISRLFWRLSRVRQGPRVPGSVFESLSRRTKRHAPIQQPRSLHDGCKQRRRFDRQPWPRQIRNLEHQLRRRVSRREATQKYAPVAAGFMMNLPCTLPRRRCSSIPAVCSPSTPGPLAYSRTTAQVAFLEICNSLCANCR